MATTPKPYLSYSQLSTLEFSEEKYIQSYIWNNRSADNDFLKLGKKLAVALENRELEDEDWIESIKKQMPDYPKREYKINANLQEIPLFGIFDGYDPIKRRLGEYKTGLKPNLKGWTNQMLFYSLLIWLKEEYLPTEIKVFWAKTKWSDDGQLIFSGEIKEYDIEIEMKDVIKFVPRIARAWFRIKKLCEIERQKFGKLPFD